MTTSVSMRLAAAALTVVCLCLSGCDKAEGDLSKVRPGMGSVQVLSAVGRPSEILAGDGLLAGYEEWYYPEGVVEFRRLDVVRVRRDPDALVDLRAKMALEGRGSDPTGVFDPNF